MAQIPGVTADVIAGGNQKVVTLSLTGRLAGPPEVGDETKIISFDYDTGVVESFSTAARGSRQVGICTMTQVDRIDLDILDALGSERKPRTVQR